MAHNQRRSGGWLQGNAIRRNNDKRGARFDLGREKRLSRDLNLSALKLAPDDTDTHEQPRIGDEPTVAKSKSDNDIFGANKKSGCSNGSDSDSDVEEERARSLSNAPDIGRLSDDDDRRNDEETTSTTLSSTSSDESTDSDNDDDSSLRNTKSEASLASMTMRPRSRARVAGLPLPLGSHRSSAPPSAVGGGSGRKPHTARGASATVAKASLSFDGRAESATLSSVDKQRKRSISGGSAMLSSPLAASKGGTAVTLAGRRRGNAVTRPSFSTSPTLASTSSLRSSTACAAPSEVAPSFVMVEDDLVYMCSPGAGKALRGGTLRRLVDCLCGVKGVSRSDYTHWFLLTYTSFVGDAELLDMLFAIYGEHAERADCQQSKVVRLRLANFVKMWLDLYYADLQRDIVERCRQFVGERIRPIDGDTCADKLVLSLQLAASGGGTLGPKVFAHKPPKPVVPTRHPFTLLDLDPLEVARQITLVEAELFGRIRPQECIGCQWSKKPQSAASATSTDEPHSPRQQTNNILEMIKVFNRISTWVSSTMVREPSLRKRVALLERFVRIGVALRELHNFQGVMEIIAALQVSAVFRLRKTWEKLRAARLQEYQELRDLMSSSKSYKLYRETLHSTPAPLVPYLGIYLSDLTFIEDGNNDFLAVPGDTESPPDKWIHFYKRTLAAKIIREIQEYQHTPYNLVRVDDIVQFIESAPLLCEDEQYSSSLEVEPR
jgi:RasGEF domain/RasGEF N-terminal motif